MTAGQQRQHIMTAGQYYACFSWMCANVHQNPKRLAWLTVMDEECLPIDLLTIDVILLLALEAEPGAFRRSGLRH